MSRRACGALRGDDSLAMSTIDVLVPAQAVCRIHLVIAERLREKGHDVALVGVDAPGVPGVLENILFLERRMLCIRSHKLMERIRDVQLHPARPEAGLRINLSGSGEQFTSPVLTPKFAGCNSIAQAARLLMMGRLPDVDIVLDEGRSVAHAAPMVDSRLSVFRGINDVLARVATLMVDTAHRYVSGERLGFVPPGAQAEPSPTSADIVGSYILSMMPRQARGAFMRLGFHLHRWNVSYRFHKGRRVADTGLLAGEPWITLPDDGKRFYADPFLFEWQGRYFIFVEDCPHGSDKAVLSVAEIFEDGTATVPRCVIDEPYHLSYPQVFSHDGDIWMLPESGSGNNLVLYRAEHFPDRWVRHSVLLPDCEIFDATLLKHGGRLWLFASQRDGYGSASDTMAVFHSISLHGPWIPHVANPVRIDRAAARPGGHFVHVGDRIVLPLQDGTHDYGGALGLADLVELDESKVRLTPPVPVLSSGKNPYPRVHTLNSTAHLEAIDCISPMMRNRLRRAG